MNSKILRLTVISFLLSGCSLSGGPEEMATRQMVGTFIASIDRGDKDLAYACLMDIPAFKTLNPDASARLDAENYSEEVLSNLIDSWRALVTHFEGRSVKMTKFVLGDPWYQYKGHPAFVDNEVTVMVDKEEITFPIRGIVRIGDSWRIVDLSGTDLY